MESSLTNLLSDSCRLLHTDQVFLKTPNENVLTSVNGENGRNENEINDPILDFKRAYETVSSRLLTLKLPDKSVCLDKIKIRPNEGVDDMDEIACAISMIPGQKGLIGELNHLLAAYPTYEGACRPLLKWLNEDTCEDPSCVGKEMVRFDSGGGDTEVDIPVLHQPFVYYPGIYKLRNPIQYLKRLVNYAAIYERIRRENLPKKCCACTLFARNNTDLLIGKPGDPVRLVRYLNNDFIDFYTPLESVAISRHVFFSRVKIFFRDNVWVCSIKAADGSGTVEYN